jgi:hypothetical protein
VELAVVVDERELRQRGVQQALRQAREAVDRLLGRGVEHAGVRERREPIGILQCAVAGR